MAAAGASPVWKLLGKKPLSNKALGLSFDNVPDPVAAKAKMPPPLTPLIDGDIAFRQHDLGHVDVPNWPTFIEFAGHYFKPRGSRSKSDLGASPFDTRAIPTRYETLAHLRRSHER